MTATASGSGAASRQAHSLRHNTVKSAKLAQRGTAELMTWHCKVCVHCSSFGLTTGKWTLVHTSLSVTAYYIAAPSLVEDLHKLTTAVTCNKHCNNQSTSLRRGPAGVRSSPLGNTQLQFGGIIDA